MTGTDMKKNTEPARTEVKKPTGKCKDSHVVQLVLPIVLTVLLPGGGIFYLCGRFSPGPISLAHVCMVYPVVFVFMF